MKAVEVKTGVTFQAGIRQPLFGTCSTDVFRQYEITRDGQRFLVPTPVGVLGVTPATVVINWTAGIKR